MSGENADRRKRKQLKPYVYTGSRMYKFCRRRDREMYKFCVDEVSKVLEQNVNSRVLREEFKALYPNATPWPADAPAPSFIVDLYFSIRMNA